MAFLSQESTPEPIVTSQSIGVAVVGTGFGEKVHIPGLQAHPRTQPVAIYHRDLAKAKAIASKYEIPYASDRLEEIVALPEVMGVCISTPPFLHYEMARTVLEAGKHLLLEKPTTLRAEEARWLRDLAQKKGLATALDFEFRCVPAWQHFHALLQTGVVGTPRLIKIDWLVPGRADAQRPWNWYSRQDQGGGMLGATGSHVFDYVRWLFGPIRRLSGRLYTAIPARPDPVSGEMKAVDADDTCSLTLELVDGTPCQVSLSSVTYQGRGHWVEVYGDRGTLILGSDNQKDYVHGFRLWQAAAGEPLTEVEIPAALAFEKTYPDGRIAPFVRILDRWVQSMDQGQPVAPTLQEGLYSQLIMDLVHESHRRGVWVEVPLEDARS